MRLSIDDDAQDVPSIRTAYANPVPIVHASSALRRIAALACMLLQARSGHIRAARQLGDSPAEQIMLLFDEMTPTCTLAGSGPLSLPP